MRPSQEADLTGKKMGSKTNTLNKNVYLCPKNKLFSQIKGKLNIRLWFLEVRNSLYSDTSASE
jgi:hypothetical protein